jgi:hypothetical protein
MLILRPQAVHDKGKRPCAALDLLPARGIAAFRRLLTEGGRSGQRQDIKVKLAGRVLAAILRTSR